MQFIADFAAYICIAFPVCFVMRMVVVGGGGLGHKNALAQLFASIPDEAPPRPPLGSPSASSGDLAMRDPEELRMMRTPMRPPAPPPHALVIYASATDCGDNDDN